jgi:ATP-binding cassette subfamily B protein
MMMGGGWMSYIHGESKRPPITRALLRRVLAYAWPYRWLLVGMLVCILLTTALSILSPLILRHLIDVTLQPPGDPEQLNWLALLLIALPIVSGVISVVQRRLNATVGEGIIYDLRMALYSHLQRMSLHFFTNTKTGELMSRLNNDVVGAQSAVNNTLISIVTNLITVAATLTVMLSIEWRLTLLGVGVLPFFIWVARRLGSRLRDIARDQMTWNAQMNAMMNETLNISGALLVKLFGRSQDEVQRFSQRAAEVRDGGVKRAVLGNQFMTVIGSIGVIGTALVYWYGGHLVLSGEFTVGTIVAFGAYLAQLYNPLQALTNAPVDFATSLVSFERVFEILDLPQDIQEAPNARPLPEVRGEVEFEEVSFTYKVREEQLLTDVERVGSIERVTATLSGTATSASTNGRHQARAQALRHISFKIAPGQLVALVGPSGAGKTTLTYLIPRLYDPDSGVIRLDGHDLRTLRLDDLSRHIGMVTQETYLFHDTIRTNLLYARPDASQADLEAACRAANIHDFIAELPQGYDTIVGERGYRLSGGEKQRIALARVILKDPRILVLDEATSSLDSQSEALIQEALARVQRGRTSIVIAHRLSTILAADLILVLDRGEIVERGTHAELLALGGLYHELYQTQFNRQQPTITASGA